MYMNPSLKDQLKVWIKKNSFYRPKKKPETLSRRDIEDLMGINKATYRRGKGGAWRSSK
jgi:hypothetical protein